MKIAGIQFPEPLRAALRDGRLVVFAGAGVSFSEPANLPSFSALAKLVASGTGEIQHEFEREDAFLGRLDLKGVDVHTRAAQHLIRDDLKPTDLHRNLLRLFSDVKQVRLVTTNFDLLFEQAALEEFVEMPEIFRAPALPLGQNFTGIVHVHGSVIRPQDMVITDKDFGCAYLTEGWAREFLVGLFSHFTVLFVGYSHNDTVVTYLARALPESDVGKRFVLTENGQDPRWRVLGIEPISFPQTGEYDYKGLYEGISRLAEIIQRSVLDWQSEVTDLAAKLPPISDEESDIIEYSLKDKATTRFFTNTAESPDWIEWLDKRGYLDALFTNGNLNERDALLARWLVERFSIRHFDALVLCMARHDMLINAHLWHELVRFVAVEKNEVGEKTLSRWVSVLLTAMPAYVDNYSLLWLGERCAKLGAIQSILKIFDTLLTSHILLRPGFTSSDTTDRLVTKINPHLRIAGDFHSLNQLWQFMLKPAIPQIAEQLFRAAVGHIEDQYYNLRVWDLANPDGDINSLRRAAIEPHEQDSSPQAVDVLIDVARDCMEWLSINKAEFAIGWCDQVAYSDVPLLRRLAVHTLSMRADLTAGEKLYWLLAHNGLHDIAAHHEVFRVVRLAYPNTSRDCRTAIIDAVKKFSSLKDENEDAEQLSASYRFNWFHWLHSSDPTCALAKQALDEVSEKYPQFELREYPDLTHWMGSGWTGPESPWSVEELLFKPAAEWLPDLLAFQPKEILGPDREGLIITVADAVKQSFEWGLELAELLAKVGEWNVDLWSGLIRGWSEIDPSDEKDRVVLRWLGKSELYSVQTRAVADALLALVKNGGKPYATSLLTQANEIAAAMWHILDGAELPEDSEHWLQMAINHPAGILAEFWVNSLSIWRKQQHPVPETLNSEYLRALSDIVRDTALPGRLGRSILAGQFAFLLAVDDAWTREYLLPLFNPNGNVADFQAIWDGFLTWGRLNPAVAEVLEDAFLKAVQHLESSLARRRDRFVEYYTSMLCFHATDPLNTWIPYLFQYGNNDDRQHFASNMERHLGSMDEVRQKELWQRWLKPYWENRLQGVPSILEPGEIEFMLNWLLHLKPVFLEAVDLATKMPKIQLQHCMVIHGLKESELVQRYSEAIANLLVCLGESSPSGFFWFGSRDIINQLISSGLSPALERKLKELDAKLG